MKIFFIRLIPIVLVAVSYQIGVQNERAFPGDRWIPVEGELPYWVALYVTLGIAIFFGNWCYSKIIKK
jgi:hypothetical protein